MNLSWWLNTNSQFSWGGKHVSNAKLLPGMARAPTFDAFLHMLGEVDSPPFFPWDITALLGSRECIILTIV